MDISKNLIRLREEAGLSKNRLAQKAGLSQAYISQLEAGYKQPTVDVISRICTALGITLSDFFSEEKKDIPPDLIQLLEEAKSLTPQQRELLTSFLKTIKQDNQQKKEKNNQNAIFETQAAHRLDDPVEKLPDEAQKSLDAFKEHMLKEHKKR